MHAILHTLSTITNYPHHNQSQYFLQQGNNPHIRRQPLHRIQLTLAQPSGSLVLQQLEPTTSQLTQIAMHGLSSER